jgi:ribonucleoside-diphosphate reductase alpha chain
MQEKQGIQQELLPGAAAPQSGAAEVDIAPVVAAPRAGLGGLGGEQIMFGGMQETLSGACPDCGSQLEYAEGCVKCHVCGYSECG